MTNKTNTAKVLIITGASSGIGYKTAELFLQQGWQVINLSRKPCDIDGVHNLSIDLNEVTWIENFQKNILQALPETAQICVVHNAAYYIQDNIKTVTVNDLQRSLQVNIIAATQLNQIVFDRMAQSSSIIYIGSTLSEKAVPNAASYSTTKHAVAGLMKASCQDLQGSGIHTCCVCPGFTDTPMLRAHLNNSEEVITALGHANAAGRLVEPVEIARTIQFCADNPVINGAIIHANLGQRES